MTGLFGGAFDPPHVGHVALARAALDQLGLGELVVLVVADPGHRATHSSPDSRLRLAEAAFAGLARTRIELDPHRFTVDLLREGRFADPIFLVGADQLASFPTWKEPEEVLRLVATRPGVEREELERVVAGLDAPERVLFFEIRPIPASSTEIRERIARGEPYEELVPPEVARVVADLGLYRGD